MSGRPGRQDALVSLSFPPLYRMDPGIPAMNLAFRERFILEVHRESDGNIPASNIRK